MEAITTARASAASVYAVINRKPVIDIFSTEGEKPVLKGDIEFRDVQFRYPARKDVLVSICNTYHCMLVIPTSIFHLI